MTYASKSRCLLRPLALLLLLLFALPAQAWHERFAFEPRNFYLKVGSTTIAPQVQSSNLRFYGLDDTAQAAMDEGPYPGTGVDVSTETRPSIIVGWVLPWGNRHFSLETILAPPFSFDFYATGVARHESLAPEAYGMPTGVPPLGKRLGETMMLPPTLTLVYNFFPRALWRPYVGVGASYVFSYEERITNPVLSELHRPRIEIEDTLAWVLQAGIDIDLYRRFFLGLDVKYVGGADVTATVTDIRLNSDVDLFDPIRIARAEVDMRLDPIVYHLTLGYRF